VCLIDVCNGGEVVERHRAFCCIQSLIQVGDIANHHLLVFAQVSRFVGVENDDLVAGIGKRIRDMAAEEAAAAVDNNFFTRHVGPPVPVSPASCKPRYRLLAASNSILQRVSIALDAR